MGVNFEDEEEEGPKLVQKRKPKEAQGEASAKKVRFHITNTDGEENLRTYALEKINTSLSKENKETLAQLYNKEF